MSLVQRFLKEEGARYVQTQLDKAETPTASLAEINFNVFDLLIDFDKQMVQVVDILSDNQIEEMPLAQFRLLLTG